MADWTGTARTNYFRVKDVEKFYKWAEALQLRARTGKDSRVALFSETPLGGWPNSIYNAQTDDDENFDIFQAVAHHLQEGSVAVFMEIGAEKMCYLTGHAIAVNAQGETAAIMLSDIYELAKPLGTEITEVEY